MDWNQIIAGLINSVLVVMAVQFLKVKGIPWLNEKVPWALPIIAMLIGPLLAIATSFLTGLLGYPIDFSPILALFTGGTAVALHQIGRQFKKAA